MDYEKKYNEIVERIKEFHEAGNVLTKAQMEIILPELADSEDEKIRKEMIDYFSQFKEDGIRGVDITSWIFYLEKQKDILRERAQNITANMLEDRIEGIQHELIEFLSNAINASWVDIIKSADSYAERIKNIIKKQKEQKPITSYISFNPDDYEVVENGDATGLRRKQKEQQPTKQDEDDERIRKELLAVLNDLILPDEQNARFNAWLEKQKDASKAIEAVDRIDKYIDGHVANAHDMSNSIPDKNYYLGWDDALGKMAGILQDVYSEEKQKEQQPAVEQLDGTFNSYDMAKTFVEGQYYVMEHPERFGLCKPAEWSEEDKGIINEIASILINDENRADNKEEEDRLAYLAEKIQSLRPQPHWKPSEEQMKIFNEAIEHYSKYWDSEDIKILCSLYDDLKKL